MKILILQSREILIEVLSVLYRLKNSCVQLIVYGVLCTIYRVPCTIYSLQSIVQRVQCTVYTVQCTVLSGNPNCFCSHCEKPLFDWARYSVQFTSVYYTVYTAYKCTTNSVQVFSTQFTRNNILQYKMLCVLNALSVQSVWCILYGVGPHDNRPFGAQSPLDWARPKYRIDTWRGLDTSMWQSQVK